MKAGPQPEPRFKMLKLDILIAFGLLVLVIILAGWYAASHKSTPQTSSSAQAGWNQFSSSKYSFGFSYPGSWGTPRVTRTDGFSGSNYTVVFTPKPGSVAAKRGLSISISLDSENYQRKVCPDGKCVIISTAITSKVVQSGLKNTTPYVKHDASSYGSIVSLAGFTRLQEEQIVQLPNIKVSAASASYIISNSGSCPQNKFAMASVANCINAGDYKTVNEVLKSIKA